MDPFSMMLGYGLVNSLSQLIVRPLGDRFTAKSRQHENYDQMEYKHQLDLEALRLNKQIERETQIDIQKYCHECRIKEAEQQFEKQLKMWQIGQFNDKMWPLLTPFDHPSLHPTYDNGRPVPLNIFMAKTDPHSPFAILVEGDLKNRLSSFLQTTYASDPTQQHPCVCRIGDWKDGFQDAAFINALWFGLQGQPTLVVNPIQTSFGETLTLNISLWGLGEKAIAPATRSVLSGNFNMALGRIKRDATQYWLSHGLPVYSQEMKQNQELLNQEELMKQSGHGQFVDELLSQYVLPKEIQNKVISQFSSYYSNLISAITAMYADIYHLMEYGAPPFMPQALKQFATLNGAKAIFPTGIAVYYRQALANLVRTNYLQDRICDLYLSVASMLTFDPECARQVFCEGIAVWANRKSEGDIKIPESVEQAVKTLHDHADVSDTDFMHHASYVLSLIASKEISYEVEHNISDIESKHKQRIALQQQQQAEQQRREEEQRKIKEAQLAAQREQQRLKEEQEKKLAQQKQAATQQEMQRLIDKYLIIKESRDSDEGTWGIDNLYINETKENAIDLMVARAVHDFTHDGQQHYIVTAKRNNYIAWFFVDENGKLIKFSHDHFAGECWQFRDVKHDLNKPDIQLFKFYNSSHYNESKELPIETLKQMKGFNHLYNELLPQLDKTINEHLKDREIWVDPKKKIFKDNWMYIKAAYNKPFAIPLNYLSRTRLLNEPLITANHKQQFLIYSYTNAPNGKYPAHENTILKAVKRGVTHKIIVKRNLYCGEIFIKDDGSEFVDPSLPPLNRCFLNQGHTFYSSKEPIYNEDGLIIQEATYIKGNISLNLEGLKKLTTRPKYHELLFAILKMDALSIKAYKMQNEGKIFNGDILTL